MSKRGFTILEIIIAVVVVGVLATIAVPSYQNVISASKDKVCEANLKTLQQAVDQYVTEHSTVPGSLSDLEPRHIEYAYARVMSAPGAWRLRVAQALASFGRGRPAFAQSEGFFPELHCPYDTNGGVSYGLNKAVADLKTEQAYLDLPFGALIVADADTVVADLGAVTISESDTGISGKILGWWRNRYKKAPAAGPEVQQAVAKRPHVLSGLLGSKEEFVLGITKGGTVAALETR